MYVSYVLYVCITVGFYSSSVYIECFIRSSMSVHHMYVLVRVCAWDQFVCMMLNYA
jgi:hypothetical protein